MNLMGAAGEGGVRMGAVTSTAEGLDGRPFALGYLRCRAQGSQVCLAAPYLPLHPRLYAPSVG